MNTRGYFWSAVALTLFASPLAAHDPYLMGAAQGGYGYGYSGCATCNGGYGCWAGPGCCERPVSKNDHLWDNYCQEKWCPTVCPTYLQPYWREGPMCVRSYAAPTLGHPEPIEATPVSSSGKSVIRGPSQPAPQPTPAPQQLKTPPSEVKPMPPSETPKNNEPGFELKLIPTKKNPT